MKKILLSLLFSSTAFAGPGRFQLIQLGELARNQFLLDTETGHVWNIMTSDKGNEVLTPILFACYDANNKDGYGNSISPVHDCTKTEKK